MDSQLKSRASGLFVLLLCLLWAFGPLRTVVAPVASPGELPYFERQALPLALLAVIACAFLMVRRARWPRGRRLIEMSLTGICMFVLPGILLQYSSNWVPPPARTALLTLVPVFTVVLEPYIDQQDPSPRNQNCLLAALTGVAGALCVFPIAIPSSTEAVGGFAAAILAAVSIAAGKCKAVALVKLIKDEPSLFPGFVAVATTTSAISLFAASLAVERPVWDPAQLTPELFWSAGIELPALLLLFWLMRQMSAVRMTVRFVLAPLIAITTGAALIRSPLAGRTWAGLALMAAACGFLLLAPEENMQPKGLSLH